MVSVNEAMGATGSFASVLNAGMQQISEDATVSFTPYVRVVLPLDCFVYWVRGDLVGQIAPGSASYPTSRIEVKGSLHITTQAKQEEVSSLDYSTVFFTTQAEVREFHDCGFDLMWIGDFENIRFAITESSSRYKSAQMFHYIGETVLPTLMSQIIDDPCQIDMNAQIVSNSLPFWLEMCRTDLVWLPGMRPTYPIFPSSAVPDNIEPPYAVVHNDPDSVTGSQGRARFTTTLSRAQLVFENVRITFYGVNNDGVADFIDFAGEWTLANPNKIGLSNIPVIKDLKEPQPALNALAMRKQVDFRVNYYQSAARDIAVKYILHCVPNVTVSRNPI